MKGNLYKYTIENIDKSQKRNVELSPLVFEARNHDDLFRVVEMMKSKIDLDENDATAFAVGLKLFGEVMLKNKENELFSQFNPHFRNFMKELKKSK